MDGWVLDATPRSACCAGHFGRAAQEVRAGAGEALPETSVSLLSVLSPLFSAVSLSPLLQVLVLRNIAGLRQAFLLFVWGTLKYFLILFLSYIHSISGYFC